MKSFERIVLLACALGTLTIPVAASARDVDGLDCGSIKQEFGDAPEGVLAYPGVIGKFPTCMGAALASTREVSCPASSPLPGLSGFVRHFLSGDNYWLGCHSGPQFGPIGVDGELDGKMNQPAIGVSACDQNPTDCIEAAFGLTFDQDECFTDGSDAGVLAPSLVACERTFVSFATFNCLATPREARLNILIDMNQDGDWNDNETCATGCAREWAIKNESITIPPGCGTHVSTAIQIGTQAGPAWMRVTISDDPVPDNFPWAGTESIGGLHNGETEDYPVLIQIPTPALPSTWGQLKSLYRI
jgi:hypothetical protein